MRQMDIHEKYENLDPWFEKINYEKVVPTIVDNGLVLWESRAIAKYLVQKYATKENRQLYPVDITQQSRVDRLLYFDQGVLSQNISKYFKPQEMYNDIPNPILGGEIEHSLQLLEKIVSKTHYALGGIQGDDHLTIADFSFLASLSQLDSMDYSYEQYENIRKYVDSLKDELLCYRECCLEGVGMMRDWARRNFKYLPGYLTRPSIFYDDQNLGEQRV